MEFNTYYAVKNENGVVVSSAVPDMEAWSSESPTIGLIRSIPIPVINGNKIVYYSADSNFCYDANGIRIPYFVSHDEEDLCYASFLVSRNVLKCLLLGSVSFIEQEDGLKEKIYTTFKAIEQYYPATPYLAHQQSEIIDIIVNSAKTTSALAVQTSMPKLSFGDAKLSAYRSYIDNSLHALNRLLGD